MKIHSHNPLAQSMAINMTIYEALNANISSSNWTLCVRARVCMFIRKSMNAFKSHQMSVTNEWNMEIKTINVLFGNLFGSYRNWRHNFNREFVNQTQNRDIGHINKWYGIHNLNTQFRLRFTFTFKKTEYT